MAECEGTWQCPDCGTRYVRDIGRCGDLTGCSRPQVVCVREPVTVTREDGLTDAEGEIADALCTAANAYGRLPQEHPDEWNDFTGAIHRCQDLLAIRIARRHYPEGWPVKTKDDYQGEYRQVEPDARERLR